jgi:MFS-type transporter involved in bile tolerance (Atg22 family)
VVLFSALAGGGVFWVPCLRDQFHLSNAQILVYGSITPMVVAMCLWWLGRLVDRTGSRPVLALADAAFALHFCSWAALSAGVLPLAVWSLLLIQVLSGLAWASFNLANARLAMSIVPAMGRSHFFALFSVAGGLVLGVLPVFWGIGLDALAGWKATTGSWEWNQFSVLYLALAGVVLAAQVCHARLTEPRAMKTEEFLRELFVDSPARAITRLIARRPFS